MRLRPNFLPSILLALILASGCASTVKVTSDPPGALVRFRGSGRASYRWKTVGITPCEYRARYNAVKTVVFWKDGTASEIKRTEIPFVLFGEPEPVHFTKPKP
jgi:hypothetical protein